MRIKTNNVGLVNVSNSPKTLLSIDDGELLFSLAGDASVAIWNARDVSNHGTSIDEILKHATMLDREENAGRDLIAHGKRNL